MLKYFLALFPCLALCGAPCPVDPLGVTPGHFVVPLGCSAYWPCDESNTLSVVQSLTGRNPGTLFNGTGNQTKDNSVSGIVRSGFKFDGSNDKVTGGTSVGFNHSTNTMSVSFWMKSAYILFRYYIGNNNADHTQRGWCIFSYTNRLYFQVKVGDVSQQTELQCSAGVGNSLTAGATVWTHIVVTYNGNRTDTGCDFYVNGVLYPSKALDLNTLSVGDISSTRPVAFGCAPGGEHPYTGQMDDVRIYDRVLSASEVATLYNWRGL